MRLFCRLGWHSPGPQILWNAGFWFTKCRDCERDLVRSRHRGWHVPVGAKVVWQAKAPAPRPPAQPAMLAEPPHSAAAIEPLAPDIVIEAGKPPKRTKRAKPANPIAPAHLAAAPEPAALIEPAESAPPAGITTSADGSESSQPLAPAERLDLAQFVAEMLHSAGPAVPIHHAVLGDEPGQLADSSEETEPSQATAIEVDTVEALVSTEAGAETDLHDSGDGADDLAQTLPAPAPLELGEPLELVVELGLDKLDPDHLDADQIDVPEEEAPKEDREAGEPVGEAELAEDAPPQPDAIALDPAVDPAADAEAPASSADAQPVPAAPAPAAPPAAESDPWADFLDDDDDDDDDFAWTQESRPGSPAAPRAAPERPAAPRAAPERPISPGERRGAQLLNEPFRSDIDGRRRWSKNSVKR